MLHMQTAFLCVCHQQNLSNCVGAKKTNLDRSKVVHGISSDILLSAPNTPLHKSDKAQDYANSNGGEG